MPGKPFTFGEIEKSQKESVAEACYRWQPYYREQLTIIPQARAVHELIANEARSAELAINSLRRERVE